MRLKLLNHGGEPGRTRKLYVKTITIEPEPIVRASTAARSEDVMQLVTI